MKCTEICDATELENLINSTPNGKICVLDNKEYYLTRRIVIKNKIGITVDGSNATIITKYANNDDYSASADAFLLKHCSNVTLANLVIETDVPTNITATVESIDFEEKTVVFLVDKEFKINGDEVLMAFNTIDGEGSPDYHMNYYSLHPDPNIITVIFGEILLANTYSSAKYDYLGDNRFKVYFKNLNLNLSVGDRTCIRHTIYGSSTITLSDCNDTIIKNVTMYSVPGMGIVVLPKCKNLTIDGLKIVAKEGSNNLMPGNCDGIHMTGLCGKFIMKNCVFDGLGDDALNVHSIVGTITEIIDNSTIKCNYCKKSPNGVLSKKWCEIGDIIKVFDPDSMSLTGSIRVVSFIDGVLKFEPIFGSYKKGDALQNTTYSPSLEIDNCVVRNTRARGFLIQTKDAEVKNCTFFGMSSNAIQAAPSFKFWYEAGPVENLYVHDNVIEKCGFVRENAPAIAILSNQSASAEGIAHLHKGIRLKNNTFKRSHSSCIDIMATDEIEISGNLFVGRERKDLEPINLINCTDAKVGFNKDL